MKKGLILALMVLVAVAMVMPVSANAPIVKPLPKVIIGDTDAGDFDSGSDRGILRYISAVDLNAFIDWNNDDYTSDLLHAYLGFTDATPAIQAINAFGVIPALSEAALVDMVATGVPVADSRITSYSAVDNYSFFELSLLDTTVDGGTTITADPYNTTGAFIAANGHVVTGLDYEATTDMWLAAGVTSASNQVVFAAPKVLTVVSQSGVTDEQQLSVLEHQNYQFAGTNDGWTFTGPSGSNFTTATRRDANAGDGTGPGFDFGTGVTGLTHGFWASPANLAADSTMAGRVYRALYTLNGSASTAGAAASYRVTARQTALAHFLKYQVSTRYTPFGSAASEDQPGDEVNAPFGSTDVTARLYWAVPTQLSGMGDSEYLSDQGGTDLRDYKVTYDALAIGNDAGIQTLDEMLVQSFERPAPVTQVLKWGQPSQANTGRASGVAFNLAAASGGVWRQVNPVAGFTLGSYAEGATTLVYACNAGGAADPKFTGAAGNEIVVSLLPTTLLSPADSTLYRLVWEVSTSNQEATPYYRTNVNSYWFLSGVTNLKNVGWSEFFNLNSGFAHSPDYKYPGQTVAPLAPNATSGGQPSIIESYVYSNDVPSTGDSYVYPTFDAVDVGNFSTSVVWPAPNASLTLHYVAWEDLGSDF
ncbi:hypothetical protein HQ520_04560 [bacterium]|nr:hypothetical protein [bacterium]